MARQGERINEVQILYWPELAGGTSCESAEFCGPTPNAESHGQWAGSRLFRIYTERWLTHLILVSKYGDPKTP
jgi:hypothetical protein